MNGPSTNAATTSGAADVLVRKNSAWSEQAYLNASNTGLSDWFDKSVAVSGEVVVLGAFLEDGDATGVNGTENDSGDNAGAAYVYERSGTTWSQQAYLRRSPSEAASKHSVPAFPWRGV